MTDIHPSNKRLPPWNQLIGRVRTFFSSLPGHRHSLYFLLGLSFLIKLIILMALHDKPVNNDGILYISAAKQMSLGHFQEALKIYRMPFYPMLIAGFHLIVPDWVFAGRIISLLSLVLSIIPLFLLSRDLFDESTAFWACLAYAMAPVPNNWTVYVIRGPVFILFFAWAIYFAQRAIRNGRPGHFLLAAFFSWGSLFFRIEGFIFIPFYFLFLIGLLITGPENRRGIIKGLGIWSAPPLCLVMLTLSAKALGIDLKSFNRFDFLFYKLGKVFNLRVLEKYREISQFLDKMGSQPPFSGYHQNFAVLMKKFIPIVYFIGLVEKLIKVLFIFNIVPLFKGIRHKIGRQHCLVLLTVLLFILLVYTRMVEKDFLSSRFLFIAAFLLFPWVGRGLDKMMTAIRGKAKFRLLFTLFLLFFIIAPLGKIAGSFNKHDQVLVQAGEWLQNQANYPNRNIVVNDTRILFYSGRDVFVKNSKSRGERHMIYHNLRKDYSGLEESAREYGADLIVIKGSIKAKAEAPEMVHYKKIKEFEGKKDFVQIFLHPDSSRN